MPATSSMQWAYTALQQQLPHTRPNHAYIARILPVAQEICPNLLVAEQKQPMKALLLVRRTEGLAGVPLAASQTHLHNTMLSPPAGRRARQLYYRLAEQRVRVMGEESFGQPLLLVHGNHLLGWSLGERRTAGVYAHTLEQLAGLRPSQLETLDVKAAVLAPAYCEWDHWREVAREPGWRPYMAPDAVLDEAVRGALTVAEITERAEEVRIY